MSLKISSLVYLPEYSPSPDPACFRLASYNSIITALKFHFPAEQYRAGNAVRSISQTDEQVSVTLQDGTVSTASLLVCADGTSSTAREMLSAGVSKDYAGYFAWRGLVEESLLSVKASDALKSKAHIHLTPDGHMLSYPIPVISDDLELQTVYINWLWYRNTSSEELTKVLVDKHGIRRKDSVPPGLVRDELVTKLREEVEAMPQPFRELVRKTEAPFVQVIFDQAVKRMAFGRVCLLGDAAFAPRPHIAVGTAKAAEDAWELHNSLKENGGDVVSALRIYEEKQMKLGTCCVQRSKEVGNRMQRLEGTWEQGRMLEFGLFKIGDSSME